MDVSVMTKVIIKVPFVLVNILVVCLSLAGDFLCLQLISIY